MKRSWMPVREAGYGPRRSIISKRKLYKVLWVQSDGQVTGTYTPFNYIPYLPKRVKGKWVPGKEGQAGYVLKRMACNFRAESLDELSGS